MTNGSRGFAFFMMVLVAIYTLQSSAAIAGGTLFKKNGILKNGIEVNLLVNVQEYIANGSPPEYWGADADADGSLPPKTFIEKLTIMAIPSFRGFSSTGLINFSAYSDLGNINSIDFNVVDEGFNIVIDGGSTATHYKAIIYFDNDGFLLGRKVYSAEFPDEVWEETKYSFIRREDM